MAEFEHYLKQEATQAQPELDNLETELTTLPDKLKGKSLADVAKMYTEIEQLVSRQGNELGELRRLASNLMEVEPKRATETSKEVQQPTKISADELLADPNKSLERAIESNPVIREVVDRAKLLERELATKTFANEYPNYQKDLNDTKFVDWVKKNPLRADLIQRANNYDVQAARNLWSMWGEYKELVTTTTTQNTEVNKRQEAEKAASLESATGSDSTTELPSMNRAEMRELQRRMLLGDRSAKAKWEDPKFKEARLKAYAEGRVK